MPAVMVARGAMVTPDLPGRGRSSLGRSLSCMTREKDLPCFAPRGLLAATGCNLKRARSPWLMVSARHVAEAVLRGMYCYPSLP